MEHVNRRPESIIGNAVWEFFTSPDDVVQSRTVEAMKRVGVGQPEVVDVLLHANTEREHRVRSAATRSLAKNKPNEQDLLRILPALTQYLHGQREYVWLDIMDVLGALLSGRAIPGYRWKSLQKQNERRQRLQSWGERYLSCSCSWQ